MSQHIPFFATKEDILPVLKSIEALFDIQYAQCIRVPETGVPTYPSAEMIPDLSIAHAGDQNHNPFYMLIESGVTPITYSVKQRRGGVHVFLNQSSHLRSIILVPGGLHGDNCVIAGNASNISTDPWARDLYKFVAKAIRKEFTKVRSYYVGRHAEHLLDEGWRLTSSVKSLTEYDLSR